ncbi:TPA: M15 family metallopeptidase [Streptococcus suis]
MKKFIALMLGLFLLISHTASVQAQTDLVLPDIKSVQSVDPKVTLDDLLAALPKEAALDDPMLTLVNRDNLLDAEPWMPFAYSENGMPYHEALYYPLAEMRQAAANAGYYYTFISGYRTIAEQANNRMYRYNSYINEGYSEGDAQYWTDLFYAPSNGSEHTTGLAVDLLGTEWAGGLTVDYAWQASALWLADHAHEYGFILRYVDGKTPVTGINFEPWHFRYVGKDHAAFMTKHQLVLEEYLALIKERDARAKKPD